LNITLIAHQSYNPLPTTDFFLAVTNTYLPLLDLFCRLEAERLPFNCSIVFSPTFCARIAHPAFPAQYGAWLDQCITLGEKEGRAGKHRRSELIALRSFFTERLHGDILGGFRHFISAGHVEALATAATYCFLPHYADMQEVLTAQVEVGIQSHVRFFGTGPDGFYLPHMGYANGIEDVLERYGIQYTILDSSGLLFATPQPRRGIFSPARGENSLVFFGRDGTTTGCVDPGGPEGFLRAPVYCNQKRDLVFECAAPPKEFLGSQGERLASGYCYWANDNGAYTPHAASLQAKRDAEAYFKGKKKRLHSAMVKARREDLSLINVMPARVLGTKWKEGILWLEHLFRLGAEDDFLSFEQCRRLAVDLWTMEKLTPYPSANAGSGYGENLLDHSNAHLLRYARKTSQRMIEIACRFPIGNILRTRMLNLAARKTLLAQSCDWPRMIQKRHHAEYAEAYFIENIRAFNTIFDALGANTLDTEWLAEAERRTPLFPWINYRVFASKKPR
jgi:1,4-alpha-glucan branching enzyme